MSPPKKEEPGHGSPLSVELWPIDRPIPYARNARKLSARALDVITTSLKEFGFRQPIVVDKEGVIIAGHTRLMGAKKLGMAVVPVHVATDLTPGQVKAYRLMDNRSAQETTWDFELLGPELFEITAMEINPALTGFDRKEMTKLLVDKMYAMDEPAAGAPQLGGLEYRVIVDCKDEAHQTELIDRFEHEGLACRALIS
jgi:ParB-like chromosome segregation protein Spo0J